MESARPKCKRKTAEERREEERQRTDRELAEIAERAERDRVLTEEREG